MCDKAQGQGSNVGDKFCESIHCKYIRKQENIRLEIEVVKISNSFTLKCTPYVECELIIIVTNIFVIQFWIKLLFWRKLSFREASDWWSIVVRINSFLCEKWKIIFNYCLCVSEIWGLKIWNKIGKRCLKKLKRVNKSKFKIKWDYFSIFARFIFVDFYLLGKRSIFLPSWWNARQSTFESGKLFNKETRIIPLKIMKYDWKNQWLATLKIARVMRRSTIRSSKVTVVADFIII